MFARIRQAFSKLRSCKSGNAMLMVALGMPALIGGSGLAVDTSQWYLWKREMQFAVDQAALAGAWARSESTTESTYASRAAQEYGVNLQVTEDFASEPNVSLVNYGVGVGNAVRVTAVGLKRLPFSNLLTGRAVRIIVSATASYSYSETYSGCLTAINPHASGAFTLGGSASGSATCGVIVLSDAAEAATQNGSSDAQFGTIVAAGGIDADLLDNAILRAYTTGLGDPFSTVDSPEPSSSPAQTYSCPVAQAASSATTATVATSTVVSYVYVTGNNANQARSNALNGTGSYNYTPVTTGSTTPGSTTNNVVVPSTTVAGTVDGTPTYTWVRQVRNSPKVHEVKKTVVKTTYSNIVTVGTPANDGIARPQPGRYTTINITCETRFAPGIYVVDDIDFGQNMVVTGTDVLFVVKNANGMHINSNSNITLSGITQTTLTGTYGYTSDYATRMAGMLFYDTTSTEEIRINGNSDVHLNGIIYTPQRPLLFNGTASVSGQCMMLVGNTITFTGNLDLNAFCLPEGSTVPISGTSTAAIKLVA